MASALPADDIPLKSPSAAPPPAGWEGPGLEPGLARITGESLEDHRRAGWGWLGWSAAVAACSLAIFQYLPYLALSEAWILFGVFVFFAAASLALMVWISKWSGWNLWIVALAVNAPLVVAGLIVAAMGSPALLLYALGLYFLPRCFLGLRRWVQRRRAVLLLLTLEEQGPPPRVEPDLGPPGRSTVAGAPPLPVEPPRPGDDFRLPLDPPRRGG